jgi:general stress protein 26
MQSRPKKSLVIFLFFVIILPASLNAQTDSNAGEISRDSLIKAAHMIIDSARCRVLVSVDEEGRPHAREMDPFAPDKNMIIWFATNPNTRKVKQIKNNPEVAVFFYDTKTMSYVSINGKAELVNDPAEKEKHWKSYWKQYYPDRDKDMILIKVVPYRMELISYRYKIFWKDESFMPQYIDFQRDNSD